MLKPMEPQELTNKELEQLWFFVLPTEALQEEIEARIDKGEKFPCLKVEKYWGGRVLMPAWENKEDIQNLINDARRNIRVMLKNIKKR